MGSFSALEQSLAYEAGLGPKKEAFFFFFSSVEFAAPHRVSNATAGGQWDKAVCLLVKADKKVSMLPPGRAWHASIHSANVSEHLKCASYCSWRREAVVSEKDKHLTLVELTLYWGRQSKCQ